MRDLELGTTHTSKPKHLPILGLDASAPRGTIQTKMRGRSPLKKRHGEGTYERDQSVSPKVLSLVEKNSTVNKKNSDPP